jgi:hypothetical protein
MGKTQKEGRLRERKGEGGHLPMKKYSTYNLK